MLLKKVINFLKLSFMYFIGYSIVMFFYTVLLETPLGKGYVWDCYEPGCSVINDKLTWDPSNKNLMPGITGDICELSLTDQYIFGRVCEPNVYSKEHNSSDTVGYFILDKINLTKKLGMSHEEFLQECKKSDISNCRLKYSAPLSVVYDPYYWYIIISDMFE